MGQLSALGDLTAFRGAASGGPPVIAGATLKFWLAGDVAATLWQDSGRTTHATADNDPVGDWDDGSLTAANVSQAVSGNKPALKLAAMNGLNVVRFSGAGGNTKYLLSATLGAWGTTNGTLFAVWRGNVTGQNLIPVGTIGAGLTGEYLRFGGDGNGYARNFRSARYNAYAVAPNDTAAHLFMWRSGVANFDIQLDRVQTGTTQSAAWQSPSQWSIGAADPTSESAGNNIDIGEIVAYDAALSDADVTTVGSYLSRWGV